MTFTVLSTAELEAAEAAIWYDSRRAGLGDAYLAELQVAFDRIRSAPRSFGILEGYSGSLELRPCVLNRFPYLVVFLIRADEIIVAAVSHVRRRPLYWLSRLA